MAEMELTAVLDTTFSTLARVLEEHRPQLAGEEVGTVLSTGNGIARVSGLPGLTSRELLRFPTGLLGTAFNLKPGEIGVVLLGDEEELKAGDEVSRTGRVLDTLVGEPLIGRVVDAIGRPLDAQGPLNATERRPIERPAPAIMDRAPVSQPLQTGIKVVDALIPIGRGQRELIIGDRQTGKTAIALDTILNQTDVLCIYCAIGQQDAAVAKLIDTLQDHNALAYTTVVVATGEDAPGLQFAAPYAATTMAEYFMEQGRDVLIVYDDLTHHARAYRELSLLLRRPPGREAYPGDIFYIHSRLLERATHLRQELGGGSLTALPIIETQAQNISAYIPTNLISITDGQIYLSPDLFSKGILPAVEAGRSVSRVGGKAQLSAYQSVVGDLRLAYSQFQELESFARFGTRLDEETRHTLRRGRRVREVLKQPQYTPLPVPDQIAVLLATTEGLFDDLSEEKVSDAAQKIYATFQKQLPDIYRRIGEGQPLSEEDHRQLIEMVEEAIGASQTAVTPQDNGQGGETGGNN